MSDFSMEDAGDQFEDDLLKAMQNSLEVNTVPLPVATQPNPAYRGMYNYLLTYMIFTYSEKATKI